MFNLRRIVERVLQFNFLQSNFLHYNVFQRNVFQCKFIFLSLILLNTSAFAENSKKPTKLIVRATKISTQVEKLASSVTVITEEEIKKSQKTRLSDLLRTVPGVDVVRSGGLGGNTAIFMRGANSEHTLVVLDGIELNDPSSTNRAFNFADISLDNIEQIEILRGPQSTLYGSDALGGVINIITKKGEKDPKASFSTEAGSFETYTHKLNASTGFEKGSLSIAFSRQDSGNISSANENLGNNEEDPYENNSLSFRGDYNPSENLSLNITGRFTDAETEIDNFAGAGGDDLNRLLENRNTALGTEISYKSFAGRLENSLGFSYTNNRLKDNNTPDELSDEFLESRFSGDLFKINQKNKFILNNFNTILFGLSWEEESGSSFFSSDGAFGPFESILPNQTARTTGAYLQEQLDWENFFLSMGIRADHHSSFGTEVTWKIAPGVYFEETGTRLRSTVGTGFKAPSIVQLFSGFGNTELNPEESLGFDVGIEQEFLKGDLVFGATYFWNDFDNLITFNPDTFILNNIAKSKTSGFELTAKANLLRNLSINSNFTFQDTEDSSTGLSLLRRPDQKGKLSLNYTMSDKTFFNLDALYIGRRKDNNFNTFPSERVTLPSYTLLNFSINHKINERYELFARAENIFNRKYEEVFGFGTRGVAGYGGIKVSL